tara:strand:- start:887 stop:1126 length:240 start_codon:yes stop_codon:yes gene_type:complete
MKMKTVYQRLKPKYKNQLRAASNRFSTAKRLKYTLMSYVSWQSLSLDNISEFFIYTDQYSFELTGQDIMFGEKFLINNK